MEDSLDSIRLFFRHAVSLHLSRDFVRIPTQDNHRDV